jgi:hypothetical protein
LDAKYGNFAWAHVREPNGVIDPPSLVHVHGLGVEFDPSTASRTTSIRL